jgi:hypothetical protein
MRQKTIQFDQKVELVRLEASTHCKTMDNRDCISAVANFWCDNLNRFNKLSKAM